MPEKDPRTSELKEAEEGLRTILPPRGRRVLAITVQRSLQEAYAVPLRHQATQAASLMLSRSFVFPLGTPDEVEHERHGRGRVRLEQEVAGVENVGFHPRQSPHPRQDLGEMRRFQLG
jgi:hypothetical protein